MLEASREFGVAQTLRELTGWVLVGVRTACEPGGVVVPELLVPETSARVCSLG